MISLNHYLFLAAFLFAAGLALVLTRRNVVVVLMGIELMLNAANLNLIAFARYDPLHLQGQAFALFVMVVAAAEAAVALGILVQLRRTYQTSNLDEIKALHE
ncbi:MAG: NADH-quinone oxidoreductase subunit NuoK [Microscillaceae bacterium]|nr:NADH-quinone oxidoreductase subunit NuoK [Microscillaceae bacterium]